jgi:hypothetical protein
LFDYKDGAVTKKRTEGRHIIRKWVSGFANSVGGVLIIGVSEPVEPNKTRKIATCERTIGRQSLIEWADHCLQDMVGYFSPPPRFRIIEHKQGFVLTIAVARSPLLIPCEEDGELKYFLRLGASTVAAPAYLIADLVLGRRQHPSLDLHRVFIEESRNLEGRGGIPARVASFRFDVENISLITADEVTVGVISWSLAQDAREEMNNHLRSSVDIVDLPFDADQCSLVHMTHRSSVASSKTLRVAPFQRGHVRGIEPFSFPRDKPLKVTCAVYVIPKSALPTWFQLEFQSLHPGIPLTNSTTVIRKGSERPKVAWEVV